MLKQLVIAAIALGSAAAVASAESYVFRHVNGPRSGQIQLVRVDRPQADRPAYALTGQNDEAPGRTRGALMFMGPRHNQTWVQNRQLTVD